MRLIFTMSNTFFGSMIRWGTSDSFFKMAQTDHVALAFDSHVLHSTADKGVHSIEYSTFSSQRYVVAEYKPKIQLEAEDQALLFYKMAAANEGVSYDISAMLYFAYRGLLWKFLEKPFPKKNKWNIPEMDFCVELIEEWRDVYFKKTDRSVLKSLTHLEMVHPQLLLNSCREDDCMEAIYDKWSG